MGLCEFLSKAFFADLEVSCLEDFNSGDLGNLSFSGDFIEFFSEFCFPLSVLPLSTTLEDFGVENIFMLSGVLTGVLILGDSMVLGDFFGDVLGTLDLAGTPDLGDKRLLGVFSAGGTNFNGSTLIEKSSARCLTFEDTGLTSHLIG